MSSRPPSIKHRNIMNYHTMLASTLSTSPGSFYTPNDTPHLRPQHEQDDFFSRLDTADLPQQQQQQQQYNDSRITARSNSSDTLNTQEQQLQQQHQHHCSCSRQVTFQTSKNDETEDEDDEQQPLLSRRDKKKAQTSWLETINNEFSRISASLYLENTGSVARDHLANERTYLAWVRTSLSTISVGVGITQLFRLDRAVEHDPNLQTWGRPVGLIFIGMSMLFLCFAFIRYFHSQTTMTKGYFPASRGIILSTSAVTFFSMVLLLIAVLFKR
ncbi:hypothetical protein BDA99DRAFT_516315 [Phascolomyces articulosus]|uniref:DUF202 domain-containing protein n=1 Tax=Phascolomyces articulosus TaxID=60185 RepID=A0AAD5JWB0_9FUNG|nr:hypothetical protein BDA99DRAFT_516315 [Phascolomyces articulosus]